MANIFKSKEVYKHVPGINSGDRLYAVRGMYVSGEHKVPYYIDAGIHIKSIQSNKLVVKDFTEASYEKIDHVVNLINIEVTNAKPVLTQYSTASIQNQDHVVNLINIEVTIPKPPLLFYQTTRKDNQDHVVNLIGIDVINMKPSMLFYNNMKQKTLPEPMVCVKSIISTKAIISDK